MRGRRAGNGQFSRRIDANLQCAHGRNPLWNHSGGAVVVPGSLPSRDASHHTYALIIKKYRDDAPMRERR
jgi:hypothetical protein